MPVKGHWVAPGYTMWVGWSDFFVIKFNKATYVVIRLASFPGYP